MGVVERDIADRARDSLAEIAHLDVGPLFRGFAFRVDGVLVAGAWDGAFQMRHHGRQVDLPPRGRVGH